MSEPMSTNEAEQGVERDRLASLIERQPALMSTGSDQQDWFRSREIAENILAAGYLSPEQAAAQIATAEQRGREDNADHGMCYVAGSEALAARERQAGAAVLREAIGSIQAVYDIQCPVGPPDGYVDKGAHMAHQWWQTVLGSTLRDLTARAERLEAGK